MVVAFCGHASYVENPMDENRVLRFLENEIRECAVEFFLGEYGAFDSFAYRCAKKYKDKHPQSKLIFIAPYISYSIEYTGYLNECFDEIIYPPLENVPLKYAIVHRNRWIVNEADLIVSYVSHKYGGAYATYSYARRKNKRIYNISPCFETV